MNHFELSEMRCKDDARTPYPAEWTASRWPPLQSTANVIREAWGEGLAVMSGYRTREYNATRPGAAKESQHTEGRAMDLWPVGAKLMPRAELRAKIRALHDKVLRLYDAGNLPDLGGLGIYDTFIHIDTRQGWNHLARWDKRREPIT